MSDDLRCQIDPNWRVRTQCSAGHAMLTVCWGGVGADMYLHWIGERWIAAIWCPEVQHFAEAAPAVAARIAADILGPIFPTPR